jgi:hypothetical protein
LVLLEYGKKWILETPLNINNYELRN